MKKTLSFTLAVLLLLALSLPVFAGPIGAIVEGQPAKVHDSYLVICKTLNVREDASTLKSPLARVHRSDELKVLCIESGWAKILWNDGYAYVFALYIAQKQAESLAVPENPEKVEILGGVAAAQAVSVSPIIAYADTVDGDLLVEGTGVPGSTIFIQVEGREVSGEATVEENGSWEFYVPSGNGIEVGDTVTAIQREAGKKDSAPVQITVVPLGG